MKNMTSNATQDAEAETGSINYASLVDLENLKNEKAPLDNAGATET
jgi:hypothetical protein